MSVDGQTPVAWDIVELDEVDSTNSEAIRRVAGLSRPTWLLAHRQTAGRGRRGRPWVDPAGNFAATLMLRPEGGAQAAAQRSFVAALALRAALVPLVGPDRIALKWPNDVLLDGGKLAGILLESSGTGGLVDWLAIGIGVNLISAPDGQEMSGGSVAPTSLEACTGLRLSPRALLDRLAPAYAAQEAVLAEAGFAAIRAEWMDHAARLGETIVAGIGTRTETGRLLGIDETGALLIETAAGVEVLPAAEVFF